MTKNDIKRRGLLLVLSSPSGAGKSTLSKRLLEKDDNITLSVSMTTRAPRPGELDGKDYNFVTTEEFESLVENDGFLEHAKVFDHFYGTPVEAVGKALEQGKDVLFDIDWQGTLQLGDGAARAFNTHPKADLVTIFILPPNKVELERRLHTRAQDSDDVIKKRMAKANDEITHWAEYDYVIINDDLEKAEKELFTILNAERLKRIRQIGLSKFVKELTAN